MPLNQEFDIGRFRESFDEKVLTELGLLTAASSAAEHALHLQIQRLVSHPNEVSPIAAVAMYGAQVNTILERLRALIKIHVPSSDLHAPVLEILDQLSARFEERNEIVRGYIRGSATGVSIVGMHLRNGKVCSSLERPLPFIGGIASAMIQLCRDLDGALTDLKITPVPTKKEVRPALTA